MQLLPFLRWHGVTQWCLIWHEWVHSLREPFQPCCTLHLWAINLTYVWNLQFPFCFWNLHDVTWRDVCIDITECTATPLFCIFSTQRWTGQKPAFSCPRLPPEGGASSPLLTCGASFKKFCGQPCCGSSQEFLHGVAQFGNTCTLEKGLWKCALKATVVISPVSVDAVEFVNLKVQLTHDLLSLAISASESLTRQSSLAGFMRETCSDETGMDCRNNSNVVVEGQCCAHVRTLLFSTMWNNATVAPLAHTGTSSPVHHCSLLLCCHVAMQTNWTIARPQASLLSAHTPSMDSFSRAWWRVSEFDSHHSFNWLILVREVRTQSSSSCVSTLSSENTR